MRGYLYAFLEFHRWRVTDLFAMPTSHGRLAHVTDGLHDWPNWYYESIDHGLPFQ